VTGSATTAPPYDWLGDIRPAGDWLGDDHEPWIKPNPGRVRGLGDGEGRMTDGDRWRAAATGATMEQDPAGAMREEASCRHQQRP
jgi:hypothetical protein